MQRLAVKDARQGFSEMLDKAQREPVTIQDALNQIVTRIVQTTHTKKRISGARGDETRQ